MLRWLSFGASEIGPAHIRTKKPNQDSWASFHHANCDVVVVSDGIGSKEYSEFGSSMACRAVDQAVCSTMLSQGELALDRPANSTAFFDLVHEAWVNGISPLSPNDASATCLFVVRENDENIWLGMLGDGLIAAVLNDGSVKTLHDSKNDSFSNITDSLAEQTPISSWKTMLIPVKDCRAVVLCTDGISDDLIDPEGFVRDYVEAFCDLPTVVATSSSADMLVDWPTPKHSDDKTIACLFRREYPDDE